MNLWLARSGWAFRLTIGLPLLAALPSGADAARPFSLHVPNLEIHRVADEDVACLQLTGPHGTCLVPFIQTSETLTVGATLRDAGIDRLRLTLHGEGGSSRRLELTRQQLRGNFERLAAGEYRLDAAAFDQAGQEIARQSITPLGVGMLALAIGDSITEGYWSNSYSPVDPANWTNYPASAVSKDRRNFPRIGPTTALHAGKTVAFQSWLPELNDLLGAATRQPVLIVNEGFGGITSGGYLDKVASDHGWRQRIDRLRPNLWLVHLGVNDGRAKVPADRFGKQLQKLVSLLIENHGAAPERIFIAKPCFDFAAPDATLLPAYNREIDRLVASNRLAPGPDFYAAFSTDKQKWYGNDPVHPNPAGMTHMARLWSESLESQLLREGKQKQ